MNKIIKIQKFLKKNKYNIFLINRTDEFLGEYIANTDVEKIFKN